MSDPHSPERGIRADDSPLYRYAPRLAPHKLRRLYESQAQGRLDEDLLEEVALTLYLRCLDILAVDRAKRGLYRCPHCHLRGERTEIATQRDASDEIACPRCGGAFSRREFRASAKRRQLNLGGAGDFFTQYAAEYERPADAQRRMLQIDRLVHGFHHSLAANREQPTRSVGPNLLALNLADSLRFLDELAGLEGGSAIEASARAWRDERDRMLAFWPNADGRADDEEDTR